MIEYTLKSFLWEGYTETKRNDIGGTDSIMLYNYEVIQREILFDLRN